MGQSRQEISLFKYVNCSRNASENAQGNVLSLQSLLNGVER